ncbi:MAG: Signal recognition particle GTPase FtsY [Methanophagales archaeon]|nr:signal recognition particle-docking protein FtsY [Methanophagales archaeon]MCU4140667.1 Signal recognition particle GTPase FtsY [Methanophagales archaeon]
MFERLKAKLKKFTEKVESIVRKKEEQAKAEVVEEAAEETPKIAEKTQETVREEEKAEELPATAAVSALEEREAAPPAVEKKVKRRRGRKEGEEAEKAEVGVKRKLGVKEKLKAVFKLEAFLDERDLDAALSDFEEDLLESDVALPVAEAIISNVKEALLGKRRKIGENVSKIVLEALKEALLNVFPEGFDFEEFVRVREKPVKIVFVGVNGTGKTTTIAKIAYFLKERGFSVVLASADTYRTGAVEQLEKHADALNIKVIKHRYGADPAAVVYDAVKYAEAHKKDVVLADTAGRMHTNVNLMEQLRKICRVTRPDLVIFVDEAIAGNDAVERARIFDEYVGIDASILTKADMDVKGGSAISIAYITSKPILFLGTGQKYGDLVKFDPKEFVERILA